METGEELQFEGIAKAYTKQPFMIVFEAEPSQIAGWKNIKHITAARIVGPVMHQVPKQAGID